MMSYVVEITPTIVVSLLYSILIDVFQQFYAIVPVMTLCMVPNSPSCPPKFCNIHQMNGCP